MAMIAKTEIKDLIAEEAARIYVGGTQAEVRLQIEQTIVYMQHLGINSASNGVKTAYAQFLETIMIKICSCRAADDDVSEYFKWWSQLDTFYERFPRGDSIQSIFHMVSGPVHRTTRGMNHLQISLDTALRRDGRSG